MHTDSELHKRGATNTKVGGAGTDLFVVQREVGVVAREMTGRTMKWLRSVRGQHLLEYAALIVVIIAALLAMRIYLKRGMSGQWRQAADSLGEQYDPRHTTSDMNVVVSGTTTTTSELQFDRVVDGKGTRADVVVTKSQIDAANPERTSRTGSENVDVLGNDLWK